MSMRVIEFGDTPYEHHFMDDLESFFWLILWCVIEHMDPGSDEHGGSRQRTQAATSFLSRLNPADLEYAVITAVKAMLLKYCTDGSKNVRCSIVKKLEACGNTWANNPVIVDVIIRLGVYFSHITAKVDRFSKCTPAVEFPKIIGIISEGLKRL
ncbi:hypothetical protein RSAG8_04614, partial [Rhizoctonia solani AG-8 WAC10335]